MNLSEIVNKYATEIVIEIKTNPEKSKEIMNAIHNGEIELNLDNLYCNRCTNEATPSGNEINLRLIKGNTYGIRTLGML